MPTHSEPVFIGQFAVHRDGSLEPRDGEFEFGFSWVIGRHRVRSRITGDKLILRVILCRVPSSAEHADPSASIEIRERVFAALTATKKKLPEGWRLGLLPDHGVVLEAQASVPSPMTGNGLIAENVFFALRLAPYLSFLDEIGSAPPPVAVLS